jgi:uncharacterized HAD superfamily protein
LGVNIKIGYDLDGIFSSAKKVRTFDDVQKAEYTGFSIPEFAEPYIISSREITLKDETLKWLDKHNIEYKDVKLLDDAKCTRDKVTGRVKPECQIEHKAFWINELDLDFFFEDNKKVYSVLNKKCEDCNVLHLSL